MARLPEWACFPSAVFEQLCEASETEAGRSRTIALYCDPGCGFCLTWTRLARQAGYTTNVSDTADMASAKRRLGVRGNLASCRSEEHTSELQSLMRISYAVFCLKKKKN